MLSGLLGHQHYHRCCQHQNNIAWFRYEEYERWLGQIVEGVDSLLDHAPVQPDDLINASLLGKVWPG